MSDEGFHEIQLNGKQLVFLFMATTVVVVVIFLCGVLVGRGVRGERVAAADAAVAGSAEVMPDQRGDRTAPAAAATPEPANATPPAPADEDLSYYKRLESDKAPAENLDEGGASSKSERAAKRRARAEADSAAQPSANASAEKAADKPADKPAASKPAPVVAASAPAPAVRSGEPAGEGFAVQVAALREKSEADSIVKKLSAKGYQAYVMPPTGSAAAAYRVRVGKFKSRHDAELVASRLEKEEQFKPWIIR